MSEFKVFVGKYKKYFGWPIISGLISILLTAFVIVPQVSSYFKTSKEIADLNGKVKFLENKASLLNTVNLDDYTRYQSTLTAALPVEKDLPQIVGQVQLLISKSNFKIDDLNLSAGAGGASGVAGVSSFPISVDVEGPPSAINDFLKNIKTSPMIMKLTGLEVSTGRNGIQAKISLLTYYQPVSTPSVDSLAEVSLLNQQDIDSLSAIQTHIQSTPSVNQTTVTGPRGKLNPFE